MIYVIIGMGVLFVAIGFLVTERNARYLLAGYNTMSEEERKKVDLVAYLPFFRKFHLFLGFSYMILGVALDKFAGPGAAGIFMGVYPILAYMYFIWAGNKYYKGGGKTAGDNKIAMYVLLGALGFVLAILLSGRKESRLVVSQDGIKIEGMYGEALSPTEISTIKLVAQLPRITVKTNGFALGSIHKGYFKTSAGEIVKLILNSDARPCILVTKADGKKIFFSSRERPNEEIFDDIKKALPDIRYPK